MAAGRQAVEPLRVDHGGPTEFVGRTEELRTLAARWDLARAGSGQTVLMRGEAGIGKSRLLRALRDVVGETGAWVQGSGSPHHQLTPFHPVTDLITRWFGWSGSESPEQRLADLRRALAAAGLHDDVALALLAPLLSLPLPTDGTAPFLSPEAQRRRTLDILAQWLTAAARGRPMVVVFEDLHWCDGSTRELLELLVQQCAGSPVLLLFTARTGFEPSWPVVAHHTRLALGRMSRSEVLAMIDAVAAHAPLPPRLAATIAARTDGVPLFVEELTKAVMESGEADHLIPATLEESLRTRLERLGSATEVARIAALLGRVFHHDVLHAVMEALERIAPASATPAPVLSVAARQTFGAAAHRRAALDDALDRLVEAELLFRDGATPSARYVFKHALVQDVAYASLPESRRRLLHATVASVLDGAGTGLGPVQPELLAHHYTHAGDIDRAVAAWQRAGEKAATRGAHGPALQHLRRALELLPELPACEDRDRREIALLFALGSSLVEVSGFGHPEVEAVMERARTLCERVDDPMLLGLAVGGLANAAINRGELTRGAVLAERSLQIGIDTRAEPLLLNAYLLLGTADYYRGDFAASHRHREAARHLYVSTLDPARVQAHRIESGRVDVGVAFALQSSNDWVLGYPDRAIRGAREAVELARRLSHPFSLAFALFAEVVVHALRRDRDGQRATADSLVKLAEAQGFALFAGVGRAYRAAADTGSDDTGVPRRIYDGLMEAMDTATLGSAPQMFALVAEAQHGTGRHDAAIEKVELALMLAAHTGQHFWDAELWRIKADCLRASGAAHTDVETALQRSLEIARRQQARSWELRAAIRLTALRRHQGHDESARALLRGVYETFTEGFDSADVRAAGEMLASMS